MSLYTVIIESCKDDTLRIILGEKYHSECNKNINVSSLSTKFNFIDHIVHVLDYKSPYKKYIYTIDNMLEEDNYSMNHINFNPSSIETNNGLIFDNIYEELSYIYERNDVFTKKRDQNNNVYMVYTLYMKNRIQYYKRIYKTIQDVISDIGGIYEIITLLASLINSIYNNYIILYDFNELITDMVNIKNNNNKINLDKSLNTSINKNINSNNEIIEKNEDLNKNSKNNEINEKAFIKEYKEESKIINKINDNDNNNGNNNNNININKKFNFWKFFIHQIPFCKKYYNYFSIYEDLRNKIISEETFLKNYFDINNLLIMSKENGFEIENNYKFKDLIN